MQSDDTHQWESSCSESVGPYSASDQLIATQLTCVRVVRPFVAGYWGDGALSGDVLMLSWERECACGAGAWVRAVAERHPCIFRGYKSSLIARKFSTLLT